MERSQPQPKRVFIIGSGNRIQHNFLPSLMCLPQHFLVIGIHSRTKAHYEAVAKKFNIPPIENLSGDIYAQSDVVVISAPPHVWSTLLLKMRGNEHHITLVIDTPLRLSRNDLFSTLNKFQNVVVTEDYMSFPQFELAREFTESGVLGQIQSIRLLHNGYRYHGTALIRSFFGFALLRRVSSQCLSPGEVNMELRFQNGATGEIIEPYDGDKGHIEVAGTRGKLTSDATQHSQFHLTAEYVNNNVTAYVIREGDQIVKRKLLTYAPILRKWNGDDQFEIDKNHGLIRVLLSIVEENIHSHYHFTQAFYESVMSEVPRITSCAIMDTFSSVKNDPLKSLWYWRMWSIITLWVRVKRKLILR